MLSLAGVGLCGGGSATGGAWGEPPPEEGLCCEGGLERELWFFTAVVGVRRGLTLRTLLPFRGGVCGIELEACVVVVAFRASSAGAKASLWA